MLRDGELLVVELAQARHTLDLEVLDGPISRCDVGRVGGVEELVAHQLVHKVACAAVGGHHVLLLVRVLEV